MVAMANPAAFAGVRRPPALRGSAAARGSCAG
eukprot:CAMPEP_0182885884 /NCGR_PEP_ID=MMETSP0034_2-20130328/19885_1 /TAXON_ID=156128 /ORGANISM="Nephroselmis pyriformis, Strain CCMP717" /LENGTH=31 /DNA_ID= /DNA_START= /DNA_END= /DNA_ORIENTATION=